MIFFTVTSANVPPPTGKDRTVPKGASDSAAEEDEEFLGWNADQLVVKMPDICIRRDRGSIVRRRQPRRRAKQIKISENQ